MKTITTSLAIAVAIAGITTIPASAAKQAEPVAKQMCKPRQKQAKRKFVPVEFKANKTYTLTTRKTVYGATGEILSDRTETTPIKYRKPVTYSLFLECAQPAAHRGEGLIIASTQLTGPGVSEHYTWTSPRAQLNGLVGYNPVKRRVRVAGTIAALCKGCTRQVRLVTKAGKVIARKQLKATKDGWLIYEFRVPFTRGKKRNQLVYVESPSAGLGKVVKHSFKR
jgi:hypothetical protein